MLIPEPAHRALSLSPRVELASSLKNTKTAWGGYFFTKELPRVSSKRPVRQLIQKADSFNLAQSDGIHAKHVPQIKVLRDLVISRGTFCDDVHLLSGVINSQLDLVVRPGSSIVGELKVKRHLVQTSAVSVMAA